MSPRTQDFGQADHPEPALGAGATALPDDRLGAMSPAARPGEATWQDFLHAARGRLSPATPLLEHEALGPKTTMRVGGPARIYAEPAGTEDLRHLLQLATHHGLPVLLLGRGSNLIIPDAGVAGLVISLGHAHWQKFEPQPDGRVWVGAGLRLKNLCGLATKAGLTGFEFLEGIPGSVGGALRMNAGAMGSAMFSVVETVRLMDHAGNIRELTADEMHAEYRNCPVLKDHIALGAVFLGTPASPEEIGNRMHQFSSKRWTSQPAAPSAGCIFKNPEAIPAGRLVDELGLKGARVGGALVSAEHGNFIVNDGYATAKDVLGLIEIIRARAKSERGIDLHTEVEIIGED